MKAVFTLLLFIACFSSSIAQNNVKRSAITLQPMEDLPAGYMAGLTCSYTGKGAGAPILVENVMKKTAIIMVDKKMITLKQKGKKKYAGDIYSVELHTREDKGPDADGTELKGYLIITSKKGGYSKVTITGGCEM